MHRRNFLFGGVPLSFALLAARPVRSAPLSHEYNLMTAGSGKVATIIDGDTLTLEDGQVIRLVGIQAPKLPLDRPNFTAWPLADEARQMLSELTLGNTVTLSYGGTRIDRHGRALAHLHLPDGRWVQGEMLHAGLARVYSFADNRARVAEMLLLEREARQAERGIWQLPYYAVRNAEMGAKDDRLARDIDSFQLVEGRIRKAARVGKYMYLNFGSDYRTDFTISVAKRYWRKFDATQMTPAKLQGKHVRVRGWLTKRNGPMIEATHPEQIELLP